MPGQKRKSNSPSAGHKKRRVLRMPMETPNYVRGILWSKVPELTSVPQKDSTVTWGPCGIHISKTTISQDSIATLSTQDSCSSGDNRRNPIFGYDGNYNDFVREYDDEAYYRLLMDGYSDDESQSTDKVLGHNMEPVDTPPVKPGAAMTHGCFPSQKGNWSFQVAETETTADFGVILALDSDDDTDIGDSDAEEEDNVTVIEETDTEEDEEITYIPWKWSIGTQTMLSAKKYSLITSRNLVHDSADQIIDSGYCCCKGTQTCVTGPIIYDV